MVKNKFESNLDHDRPDRGWNKFVKAWESLWHLRWEEFEMLVKSQTNKGEELDVIQSLQAR